MWVPFSAGASYLLGSIVGQRPAVLVVNARGGV